MGSSEVVAGGCSPFGLWPGVDVRWTRSLCLFEAAGYQNRDVNLVLSCPSTHRAPPPEGIELRRVLDDADADAALAWCAGHLPGGRRALSRAVEQACCFVALSEGQVAGLICHSINRAGWIGPIGVARHQRRMGIGRALVGAACADLRSTGLGDAHISGPGPIEFFARATGASVSRVFVHTVRPRLHLR
jgi:ribosomal protein S18 acetylase RimI-like enzyme